MPKRKKHRKRRGVRKTFERGTHARAERDVQARRLAGIEGIDEPFALATHQVQIGARIPNGEVRRELKEQKAAARR